MAERTFRTANWIIRSQLEKSPRYGFDKKRIVWGNERKPKRGEVIELKQGYPVENKKLFEVEWFFTYISDDGQINNTVWLEQQFRAWRTSAQNAGIKGVRFKRSPVARTTKEGSKHWHDHQRVHQELVMSWGEDVKGWRGRIHEFLGEMTLARPLAPRSVGTEEDIENFIDRMIVPLKRYEYEGFITEREARREEMQALTEKGVKVSAAIERQVRRRRAAKSWRLSYWSMGSTQSASQQRAALRTYSKF